MGIKVGDIVSLTSNAVYYNGKAIPDWVKSDRWIVKSVRGDRAVIDNNVDRTKAICAPVNTAYLKVETVENAASQGGGQQHRIRSRRVRRQKQHRVRKEI